jgi:Tfp pilus assembly protein PilF
LGYNLLGSGDVETALAVFQFVTAFFPESAKAWDSLAEGYWQAGQLDKAKEYYNKAISLDPEGSVGNNARKMLEKMKE